MPNNYPWMRSYQQEDATDAVINGVQFQDINARRVQVESADDLETLTGYQPGTIAYTAGYANIWQLGTDGEWAEVQAGGGGGDPQHIPQTPDMVPVASEQDLENLVGVSEGTIAYTAGFNKMWQLDGNGDWVGLKRDGSVNDVVQDGNEFDVAENVQAKNIIVRTPEDVAQLNGYPVGSIAYTAGFEYMWQLGQSGWVQFAGDPVDISQH